MPCLSPLHIINKTKDFNPLNDMIYMTVPCGCCSSCLETKRQNMYLRTFFEFQDTINQNGAVFFPTLTFDDAHLPWFDTISHELKRGVIDSHHYEDNVVPCFDWSCIKGPRGYIKRVRSFLRDWFDICNVKFIVCPEYGSSYEGTHRPHFHSLIFIPRFYDLSLDSQEFVISKVLQIWEDFGFGLASYSEKHGPIVNSFKGLKYVSKYMTKDVADWCKDSPQLAAYLKDKSNLEYIKKYVPRPYWSQGYGIYMVDYVKSLDDDALCSVVADGITITNDIKVDGSLNTYSLPRYVFNKAFYHFDVEHGMYIPTDQIVRIARRVSEEKYLRKLSQLRNFFHDSNYDSYLTEDVVRRFSSTFEDCREILSSAPECVDFECLAAYALLRGKTTYHEQRFDSFSKSQYIRYAIDYAACRFVKIRTLYPIGEPEFSYFDAWHDLYTYNVPRYDFLLDILDTYNRVKSRKNLDILLENRRERSRLRHLHYSLIKT